MHLVQRDLARRTPRGQQPQPADESDALAALQPPMLGENL